MSSITRNKLKINVEWRQLPVDKKKKKKKDKKKEEKKRLKLTLN